MDNPAPPQKQARQTDETKKASLAPNNAKVETTTPSLNPDVDYVNRTLP